MLFLFFFVYATTPPEIYTLSLHDALPISFCRPSCSSAPSCKRSNACDDFACLEPRTFERLPRIAVREAVHARQYRKRHCDGGDRGRQTFPFTGCSHGCNLIIKFRRLQLNVAQCNLSRCIWRLQRGRIDCLSALP